MQAKTRRPALGERASRTAKLKYLNELPKSTTPCLPSSRCSSQREADPNGITGLVKDWIVDALILGFYEGGRGPKYWAAVSVRYFWGGGFDRA